MDIPFLLLKISTCELAPALSWRKSLNQTLTQAVLTKKRSTLSSENFLSTFSDLENLNQSLNVPVKIKRLVIQNFW